MALRPLLLIDDFDHLRLYRLLLERQSVLVPQEIWGFLVDIVTFHATLEEADHVAVVWILSKTQTPTIVHVFIELVGDVLAELFDTDLFLFFLDVGILFSL